MNNHAFVEKILSSGVWNTSKVVRYARGIIWRIEYQIEQNQLTPMVLRYRSDVIGDFFTIRAGFVEPSDLAIVGARDSCEKRLPTIASIDDVPLWRYATEKEQFMFEALNV